MSVNSFKENESRGKCSYRLYKKFNLQKIYNYIILMPVACRKVINFTVSALIATELFRMKANSSECILILI